MQGANQLFTEAENRWKLTPGINRHTQKSSSSSLSPLSSSVLFILESSIINHTPLFPWLLLLMLARTRAKATTHTHNFGNLAPQQRLMTLCFAVAAAASLSLSLFSTIWRTRGNCPSSSTSWQLPSSPLLLISSLSSSRTMSFETRGLVSPLAALERRQSDYYFLAPNAPKEEEEKEETTHLVVLYFRSSSLYRVPQHH